MHGASACSPPPDKRALGCSRKRPASCTLRPAAPCSQASCLCEAEAVGLAVSLHEAHEAVPLALGLHHHHTLDDARLAVDEVRRHLRRRSVRRRGVRREACVELGRTPRPGTARRAGGGGAPPWSRVCPRRP
eukprot:scaffold50355_cov71-Phaeocystis_antarctica.AAC.4